AGSATQSSTDDTETTGGLGARGATGEAPGATRATRRPSGATRTGASSGAAVTVQFNRKACARTDSASLGDGTSGAEEQAERSRAEESKGRRMSASPAWVHMESIAPGPEVEHHRGVGPGGILARGHD